MRPTFKFNYNKVVIEKHYGWPSFDFRLLILTLPGQSQIPTQLMKIKSKPKQILNCLVELTQLLDVQQFRASTIPDVVTFDVHTMQAGMRETYLRCDPPPDLNVLSQYR